MRAVCADVEAGLVEFNGESNHVHLLVNHPPKVVVSRLVNSLKGVSSRRLRQEYLRPRPPLLARATPVVRVLHRRVRRRDAAVHRAPVHRATEPFLQGTARPLTGLLARAFTTAVNGGALARNPVAGIATQPGSTGTSPCATINQPVSGRRIRPEPLPMRRFR